MGAGSIIRGMDDYRKGAVVEAKGRLGKAEDNLYFLRLLSDQLEGLMEYVGAPVEFEISRYRKSMVLQIQKHFSPFDK
jgi:hypothetical protein